MKKLYNTLIFLAVSGLAANAQVFPAYSGYYQNSGYNSNTGSLRIQLPQNGKYVMRLNGNISFFNGNHTRLDNLQAGIYTIIIEKQAKKNNGPQRLYKGVLFIEKGQMLTANIDAGQRVLLENTWLYQNSGNFFEGEDFYCPWFSGNAWNNGNGSYGNGNYNGGNQNSVYFMDDADFKALLNTVKKAHFDSDREKIARQAISYNTLSAMQVKDLVACMDFESTRLKVAKAAFDESKDKGRFYLVNDAFEFSSSIGELNKYMNK